MRRLISILTITCLSLTLCVIRLPVSAQQTGKDKNLQDPFAVPHAKQKEFFDKLPDNLKRGASPEAKAAWEKLKPEEREKVKANVDRYFEEAKAKAVKDEEEKRAQKAANKDAKREGKAQRKGWREIIRSVGSDANKNPGQADTTHDITLLFTDKNKARNLVEAKETEAIVEAQRCYDCEPLPEDPLLRLLSLQSTAASRHQRLAYVRDCAACR